MRGKQVAWRHGRRSAVLGGGPMLCAGALPSLVRVNGCPAGRLIPRGTGSVPRGEPPARHLPSLSMPARRDAVYVPQAAR